MADAAARAEAAAAVAAAAGDEDSLLRTHIPVWMQGAQVHASHGVATKAAELPAGTKLPKSGQPSWLCLPGCGDFRPAKVSGRMKRRGGHMVFVPSDAAVAVQSTVRSHFQLAAASTGIGPHAKKPRGLASVVPAGVMAVGSKGGAAEERLALVL